METFAAEDGTALGRPEGDGSLLATLRADGSSFDLGETLSRCTRRCPQHGDAFCLAGFAPLGFIFELLVVKEQLFPGREDEVGPAVDTLQYLVLEFHGDAPFNQSLLIARGRREIADTRNPREGAEFSLLSQLPCERLTLGSARHTRQKYGLLPNHQTRMLMNRYANPNGRRF